MDLHILKNIETNPIDRIKDLTDVLDSVIDSDYIIAGGYPRDSYTGQPFNDIDVYIFEHVNPISFPNTTNKQAQFNWNELIGRVKSSNRFELLSTTSIEFKTSGFIDCVFLDIPKNKYDKPPIKYRVQIMLFGKSVEEIMDKFDFEHCKFFIPYKNHKKAEIYNKWYGKDSKKNTPASLKIVDEYPDRVIIAVDQAIESINTNKMILSEGILRDLEDLKNYKIINSSNLRVKIYTIDRTIRRIRRFFDRGMSPPDYDIGNLIDVVFKDFPNYMFDTRIAAAQINDDSGINNYLYDKKSCKEIVRQIIEDWSHIKPIDLGLFILSPNSFIREIAKELYEKNQSNKIF